MARLVVCAHCHVHVRNSERTCPHCATPLKRDGGRLAATAAAALMGLAATACEKNGPGPVEPMYGAPVVDDPAPPMPPEDSAGEDPVDPGDTPAEPEYGVPETPGDEPDVAPMYGVPSTPE